MKPLLNFDFEDLHILVCIDAGMTTAQCGKAIHITQPAVSQRLKRFDTFFGIRLHDKKGRGIGLNDAGKRLAKAARVALALLEEACPGYVPETPKPVPPRSTDPLFI